MGFNWGKGAVGSKKALLLLYKMTSLTFAKPVIYSEYAEPWKFHPQICRTNPSFLYKKKNWKTTISHPEKHDSKIFV